MHRRWPLLLVVLLPGCRTASPAASPAGQAAATRPATAPFRAPEAIRWVRDSAERRAICLEVYRAATAQVEREAGGRAPGTWAVVLDADETVIDNSPYQLERARLGLGFDPASWRAWTARREGKPIPGAAGFLARVHALGGRIAIVTNRTETECPDTEAVFRAHSLAFDQMLCKPDKGSGDKNPRYEAIAAGTTPAGWPPLDVVAFVGDNILDFPGQSQTLRLEPDAAFAPFGVRFFVLPNPMYGSWN
jgi:5'-nucleotidase (lipoprotein e(P4) family)